MIRKILHYFWFGGHPLSPLAEKCLLSWKKHCPDFEIVRWDEKNYDVNKHLYIRQAYMSKKWGFVSDYARLDVIYEHGGIYLDTDVEIIKPWDFLLQHHAFFGYETNGFVNTGLGFGAEQGSATIKSLRDEYDSFSFLNPDVTLCLTPCTKLQEKYFQSHGAVFCDKIQNLQDMVIYPPEFFSPKMGKFGRWQITRNTCSIHHYAGSWCSPMAKLRRRLAVIIGDDAYQKLKKVFKKK